MSLDPNQIADDAVEHMLELVRYSESIRESLYGRIEALFADLRHLAADAGIAPSFNAKTYRRQEALIRKASKAIKAAYAEIEAVAGGSLAALAPGEAQWAAQALYQASEGLLRLAALPAGQIEVALRQAHVAGATPAEWFKKLATDLQGRFAQLVRASAMARQGVDGILSKLEGAGGLKSVADRHLTGLLRTAVPAIANAVQDAAFRDAGVMGVQHVATLDPKTCLRCSALDGAAWDLEGNLLAGSPVQAVFPGPCPLHWQCRCLHTPVMDSRAFAAITTYQDWLAAKPADAVRRILGPARARLFIDNKLTLSDLVNPAGRKLTLDQLYRKIRT